MKRLLQVFACVVVVGWSLPAPGDEPSVPYASPSAHAGQQTAAEAAARTVTLDEAYRFAPTNEEQIKLAGRELAKAQLLPWRACAALRSRSGCATKKGTACGVIGSDPSMSPDYKPYTCLTFVAVPVRHAR